EHQRTLRVRTMRDLVDKQTDGVVVVRSLQFGRVHTINCSTETAEMVMREAHEGKRREAVRLHLLLEFTRPFLEAEEIGKRIVVTAEAEVGTAHERRMRWECDLRWRRRAARIRNVHIDLEPAPQIQEESIVPNR